MPTPLLDFWLAVVGSGLVFQQNPLDVTSAPPSLVTLPVAVMVVDVSSDVFVVKVGITLGGSFLQEINN